MSHVPTHPGRQRIQCRVRAIPTEAVLFVQQSFPLPLLQGTYPGVCAGRWLPSIRCCTRGLAGARLRCCCTMCWCATRHLPKLGYDTHASFAWAWPACCDVAACAWGVLWIRTGLPDVRRICYRQAGAFQGSNQLVRAHSGPYTVSHVAHVPPYSHCPRSQLPQRHTSVIDPDAGAVPMAEKQARRPQRAEAGRARRSSTADCPLRPLEAAVQHVPLCLGPSAMSAAKDAPTNGEGARPKITAAEVDKWLFGGDVMLLRARSEPLFATRASRRHSTRESGGSGLSVAPARVGTMAGLAGVAPGDAADERAPLDSSDDEF